jgi:hypothetical protein
MTCEKNRESYWKIAFNVLGFCWLIGTVLKMSGINGGFWTSYLTDLVFPPFIYIFIRGLRSSNRNIPRLILVGNWFGLSPERPAISIFIVGVLWEMKSYFSPSLGAIGGTYDLLDILAYGIGLLICYIIDKSEVEKSR